MQIFVSGVRGSGVDSANGARHRGRQPSWPKIGQNPEDPLVRCQQSRAGLVTDGVWAPGGKLWFLGLELGF